MNAERRVRIASSSTEQALSFTGFRLHAAGLLAHKGTSEDARGGRALESRVEQLLLAVVRGALGLHTVGEWQSQRGNVGGAAPPSTVLHLHVCQPVEITRRHRAAPATGRPAERRGAAATATAHLGARLQGPEETRVVPRGDRQLLQALGGEHVTHNAWTRMTILWVTPPRSPIPE